jgi:ribose 5-phosphate isomerase B
MIAIACDHGALTLKEHLKTYLELKGIPCKDFGTYTQDSCDYSDFAVPAAQAVASGVCEKGIVLCTTGIGVSIAANKVKGVRCALCHEPYSAEMTRRHNDANVLAMGAGVTGASLAERIVDAFLTTEFEGGRHQRRVDKLKALEE